VQQGAFLNLAYEMGSGDGFRPQAAPVNCERSVNAGELSKASHCLSSCRVSVPIESNSSCSCSNVSRRATACTDPPMKVEARPSPPAGARTCSSSHLQTAPSLCNSACRLADDGNKQVSRDVLDEIIS